jgi:hypothetical protein
MPTAPASADRRVATFPELSLLPSPAAEPSPFRFAFAEGLCVAAGALLVASLGARTEVFTIDSYYYLAKARSLMEGLGLSVPWNDGVDRMFFWGYSLALSVPVTLFGEAGFIYLAAALHAFTGYSVARLVRLLPLSPAARTGVVALVMTNAIALWWATVPMSEVLLVALATRAALHGLSFREGARGGALHALAAALFGGLALFTRAEGVLCGVALLILCGPRLLRERRVALFVLCALLFCGPELVHVSYLRAHALAGKAASNYLEVIKAHLHDIHFLEATWAHLRAPFWTIFRLDTEPWLYARHFPQWLTSAQSALSFVYLAALFFALVSGLVRRGFAFFCAAGIVLYACLHAFWFYNYERFDYLAVPAAALVLAWAADRASLVAPARLRTAALCLFFGLAAAISGAYGTRVSQMHAERLKMHQQGRDYRALGKAASAANPKGRPIVTDLGPYLAWYVNGHAFFDRVEPDFFDDVVPGGTQGRLFLAREKVGAIVTWKSATDIQRELGLVSGESHEVPAAGATVIALDLPE